jgi:hypothetical protein
MQQGVVIELDERLERNAEALAVIEQRAMVIGNPPWPGIDIEALLELAGLLEAAEFGERISPRKVQLRPPARLLNSRIRTLYPALRNSSAAVMPARPAPRMRTEAPLGSPSSLIGPLYPESAANPRLVIA